MVKVSAAVRTLNELQLPPVKPNRFLKAVADAFPRKPGDHGWVYTLHLCRPGEVPDITNIIKVGSFKGGVAHRVNLYNTYINAGDAGGDMRLKRAIALAKATRRKYVLYVVPYEHVPHEQLIVTEMALRNTLRADGCIV